MCLKLKVILLIQDYNIFIHIKVFLFEKNKIYLYKLNTI